ncbi:MAG: hypothetical protein GWN55_17010 [Phycisphaerae bacterium]|nr:hypothetical protein [Phycisphaerae bacterium]NIR68209.1 hypothetical protein [candidate division Zixibacteria bacterium]NIW50474.1 hypothetical protein [Gammaproteobacteria bacterium]NIP55920.1 hypothetical protein [Phycisphaerae bacterium]NIS54486.1 hypothetical protein [Phycisphaerae bacterium]
MEVQQFEPMSIGGILDRTFRLYKNNFVRFITIVAIVQVPITLLMLVSTSLMEIGLSDQPALGFGELRNEETLNMEETMDTEEESVYDGAGWEDPNPAAIILGGIIMLVGAILALLGNMLCQGALTKSVSEFYLGNEITVGQAYKFVLPKLLTLIGAGLLVSLIVWLGFIMCIVPGIIFGLWFALTTPSIIVENLRATKGMSRSKALASGNLGKIFSVGFLVILITWAINMPFGWAGIIFSKLLFVNNYLLASSINQLFSLVGQILATPIGAAAFILLYYDLRIRKEGFDLQMLAQAMSSGQGDVNILQP